jgi:hypothetical protein
MFKYIKYFVLMLFLCTYITIPKADAATINATTCFQTDVQAAVNSAGHGDTVIVPAGDGSAVWDDLDIGVGITLKGPGSSNLTITAGGDNSVSDHIIDLELGHNQPVRITGFTFDGNGGSSRGIYAECKTGEHKNTQLRVDNCKFEGCSRSFEFKNWIYGVAYDCEFKNGTNSDVTLYGDGLASWNRGGSPGTADAFYVEDCTFTYTSGGGGHLITSNKGARYVFRYNTLNTSIAGKPYDVIDAHGYCCASPAGTYLYEIYENTFNTTGSGYIGSMVRIRGGQGVVFNNKLIGKISSSQAGKEIELCNYRSYVTYCNSSCNGPLQTLCQDIEGYPCKHQINNLYIWNNTDDGNPVTVYVEDLGEIRTHIQKDRDYFNYQKPGYTPYTYPHPLTKPSPPSNLRIVSP